LIPAALARTQGMNEARKALHTNAVNLMRRVVALHGTYYTGCGFHWALERAAGGLLNKVCDYDRSFDDLTLLHLEAAYESLLEQVVAAEAGLPPADTQAALQALRDLPGHRQAIGVLGQRLGRCKPGSKRYQEIWATLTRMENEACEMSTLIRSALG